MRSEEDMDPIEVSSEFAARYDRLRGPSTLTPGPQVLKHPCRDAEALESNSSGSGEQTTPQVIPVLDAKANLGLFSLVLKRVHQGLLWTHSV